MVATRDEEAHRVVDLLTEVAEAVVPVYVPEPGEAKATVVRKRIERWERVQRLVNHLLDAMRGWEP